MLAKLMLITFMTVMTGSAFADGIHCSLNGIIYKTEKSTLNINNLFFVNSYARPGFGFFTYELRVTDEFAHELGTSSTLVYDEALESGPSLLNLSIKTEGGVLKCSHGIGHHWPVL